ncbi:MAG TPA: potassium-transporting ATPase subunit KdpA [Blastocatellia bacterium]|nr:potassium-transporting ATPase subunit KdpA [Blastocatellia bacterium]HMX24464.1 potassium-transporting ATPase subunit KdpA [Blastocatellia bacterium]HMY71869.1 potassium-transporting ATPase subunit KdpA [Blastocatellia bacterium]HMZ16737.1 potassium-transporting ATPase subunit KdpA [Blastocatellia bacterium]HNG28239.1 potassium-transporting ATPase subunit KdpA [Blastocatellia bacterium]
MTLNGWLQILLFFALILLVTKPLGVFMACVFNRERTFLDPVLRPIERLIYRLTGVDEAREMRWTEYGMAMLLFSVVSMITLYLLQRLQAYLPFNPQKLANIEPGSAFNTAASFTTNTNWQSYVPETTMSYLTQMAGLAYHNFISAAVGIALAVAFIRGIARRERDTLGNFWVDMTRAVLWVLLPFCLVGALLLVSQGVVQNLKPYDTVTLLDPQGEVKTQTIAQGPVASQEAIKMWGTNGGGFFNANSAHPFENPTPLTNLLEMFAIFAVSAGLTYTLGRMTGSPKHGWAVFGAMSLLFFAGVSVAYWAEARGNPMLAGTDQAVSATQSGGNMEGKEVRFGIANSALFATTTTDASCGAVNAMHDSFTPLGGLVPLANIMLGEVVFGGVGAGLYGVLIYVVLAVFIAGLMVGRTPEYLGKKIEAYDVKMAMLTVLVFPLTILIFTAISSVSPLFGTSQLNNSGPHGLSEMLYAFTSGTGNNGSAFAGISANTAWYNSAIGAAMLLGRFFMIIPMLALAGNLGRKKSVPPSPGTFPVTTPLFATLLVSVIVIVGALTFFPVLSLGPIVEHLLMQAGQTF